MLKSSLYQRDIEHVANLSLPWEQLKNTSFLISGASGLIGKFLIDVLMYQNKTKQLNCHIIAIGRNIDKAKTRFADYWGNACFTFISTDINSTPTFNVVKIDYLLHAASNTHPVQYATDPIGTITTNLLGTYNLLNLAIKTHTKRFLFTSSVEIYGENRGDIDLFTEDYCGYINCNTLRAGYPESKRAGEALCQAFIKQHGLDIVIPRLSRKYGPTMQSTDSKAIAQFIKKALAGEDIVLKSQGTQFYSYSYVADAVAGLLYCLFYGKTGKAYNIADKQSNISLRDLAQILANIAHTKVVFEIPDAVETAGYSKATKAILDSTKLQALGWQADFPMEKGLQHTIKILKDIKQETL